MVDTSNFKVVKETEKAIAYAITGNTSYDLMNGHYGRRKEGMIWIPKSMIVEGRVPAWKLTRSLYDASDYGIENASMVSAQTGNAMDVDELTAANFN